MASRINLDKTQNQIHRELMGIWEKVQSGMVRKVAVEETLRSLENKLEEVTVNHEKLDIHGKKSDPYYQEKIWDQIQTYYEKAKAYIEAIKEEAVGEKHEPGKQQKAAISSPRCRMK